MSQDEKRIVLTPASLRRALAALARDADALKRRLNILLLMTPPLAQPGAVGRHTTTQP